jgi:hypothetical protein
MVSVTRSGTLIARPRIDRLRKCPDTT